MQLITEKEARLSPLCLCGNEKSAGEHAQIVCWDCWREYYIDNPHPFKWFSGTFEEWQKIRFVKNF